MEIGFQVNCDGVAYSVGKGLRPSGESLHALHDRFIETSTGYYCPESGLAVVQLKNDYGEYGIVEQWVSITNGGKQALDVSRADSLNTELPTDTYTLLYYTSGWGKEFEPVEIPLEGTRILECTSGRSSKGLHPWFVLKGGSGCVLACAIAWSGNWIARFEPLPGGRYRLSAGLSDWEFHKALKPGETMECPHVLSCFLAEGDIEDVAVRFGRWGRECWYPKNPLAQSIPVEWNSWWPYEDAELSEAVFKANADLCAGLGADVCTLDAGWFGPSDECSQWYRLRGDWHRVNGSRFPSGIRAVSDHVHGRGLRFGIWCEIEACGEDSELTVLHPEFIARRDGEHLGYVCLGNPAAVDWAFGVLERLIVEYGADWIKLDFNLDPGAGCNRTDHGHGSGDGLYEHYMGYYSLLDRVREKYPAVVLEGCASGGLRIDLGLLRHLHMAFLSDPDYSEHHLQVAWGATAMLHPSACLHWSWSQTRTGFKATPENNPIRADMPLSRFDYLIRNAMLTQFGFSYRLPDLPDWCADRLAHHIAFFKRSVRDFIRNADLYRLTGQPVRDGRGDRWCAFQYVGREASLLFVFRLKGSEKRRTVTPRGLSGGRNYTIRYEDRGSAFPLSGSELMESGLTFDWLEEETSEIVFIDPIG